MATSDQQTIEDSTEESDVKQRRLLNEFLANCSDLRELEAKMGGFSLFRVLRFEEGEIRHSNVLAWLLDPSDSHGLDDLFLRRFLTRLRILHPRATVLPDVIDVEAAIFKRVEVSREWSDRKTRDRLDLLIVAELDDGNSWVIAIEVKVGARQSENQLPKYRHKIERKHGDASRRIYVFLTRDMEEPEEGSDFLPADFSQVHTALSECMAWRGNLVASGPNHLMEDYLRLLETRFMPNNEIEKLARKIYRQHHDALDVIFRSRPDCIKEVSDLCRKKSGFKIGGYEQIKVTKGNIRLLPNAWNVDANDNGKDKALYFEIYFYSGPVVLYITMACEDSPLRTRIDKATAAQEFVRRSSVKKGEKTAALHSESLGLEISQDPGADAADMHKRLKAEVVKALGSDEMKKRIAILAKCLKEK